MPPPSQLDGAARALGDVYREAEARINAELRAILDDDQQGNRKRRLRSLLREIESRQAHLLDEARAFLNNSLPFAWQAGASRFAIGEFTWTQGHRQAIGMLALDQFDRVLHATEFMGRDVKELIRSTGVSQARFKVTTGQTAKQAGRELESRLRRQGISAVTYRDGRNIRASTYAEMLMRTSTAVAYNLGGLNQLKGVGVQFVECVDSPDCGLITHGDGFKPNGRVLPIEVAGAYPISHPNAVMAGTKVRAIGRIEAGYRASWSGRVFHVRTAGGARLTIGPNHPVLTENGWLRANALSCGLHVVRCTGERPAGFASHLDQVPARVEDVFSALWETGAHSRAVATPEQFHGDGNYCQGEVEIVRTHGALPGVAQAALIEQYGERLFVMRDETEAALVRLRALLLDGSPVRLSASGGVSGSHVSWVGVPVSELDAALTQAGAERAVANASLRSALSSGSTGSVFLDEIVEVWNEDNWVGHAFDLSTESGVYWADSVLVHNCVRDFVSRPDVTSDQVAAEVRSLRPQDQLDDQANFVKYLREQAQVQRSAGRQPRTPREPRTPRRERVRA